MKTGNDGGADEELMEFVADISGDLNGQLVERMLFLLSKTSRCSRIGSKDIEACHLELCCVDPALKVDVLILGKRLIVSSLGAGLRRIISICSA